MKRLHNYLLTHHPLVWNMRLHWILPALLLLNLVFFLAGCVPRYRLADFDYNITDVPPGLIMLGALSSVLLGIAWLRAYLRNNALKSFYPIGRGWLATEWLLTLLIIGGLSTPLLAYGAGRYARLRSVSAGVDVRTEANTLAIAGHFLPFNEGDFMPYRDCDFTDSLPAGIDYPELDSFYSGQASYLHYCQPPTLWMGEAASTGLLDAREVDSVAKSWLLGGKRDSVKALLDATLAIVRQYGGKARLNTADHTARIFSAEQFALEYEVSRAGAYGNELPAGRFVDIQQAEYGLRTVQRVRSGFFNAETWILFGYWTFGAALLLFSFRTTRLRTWAGALVGVGIWCIVFGAVAGIYNGFFVVPPFFMALVVACWIYGNLPPRGRHTKQTIGYALLWAVWAAPLVVPVVAAWIQEIVLDRYVSVGGEMVFQQHPLDVWIDRHIETILTINLLTFVALYTTILPVIMHRWQAAPEE